MQGRVYIQKADKSGWIVRDKTHVIPKTVNDVKLTYDVEKSLVFDVDNVSGFTILNLLIEDGWNVLIGDSHIHKKQVMPSASPFTPDV